MQENITYEYYKTRMLILESVSVPITCATINLFINPLIFSVNFILYSKQHFFFVYIYSIKSLRVLTGEKI